MVLDLCGSPKSDHDHVHERGSVVVGDAMVPWCNVMAISLATVLQCCTD